MIREARILAKFPASPPYRVEARMIGYGAMLMEGFVSIIALIAASSLFPEDYFAINLSAEKYCSASIMIGKSATIEHVVEIAEEGHGNGARVSACERCCCRC